MLAMPKILLRALAFAALHIALSCSSAGAQQAQPSPLEFVETDPLVLIPGEVAQLQLRNNTSRTLTVTMQVIDLKHAAPDPLSKHVSILPASGFELKAAGGVILNVTLAESYKIDPLNSVAYLSAFESETNTFARRSIQLKAPGTGGVAPKDKPVKTFLNSWSVADHYSFRDTLSSDKSNKRVILDTYLPLAPDATVDKLSQGKPLAILFNDAGEPGVLEYNKTAAMPGGLQGFQLAFKGSGCCGKYKGKINKDAGTEKDDVDVTVVMSHHWLYPLVVLLAGVGTAFFFKERYLGVSRPLFILEEKRAEIENDFVKAQAAFKKNHASEPYVRYSIAVAVFQMLEDIGGEIHSLRERSFSTLDAEALKKTQASLDEFRRLVDEWKIFPSRLAALKAARAALVIDGSTKRPRLTPPPTFPNIYLSVNNLLNDGREMDVTVFRDVNSSVASLTALLKGWTALNERAAELWHTIHEATSEHLLREIVEDKKAQLAEVDDTLEGLWYDLWKSVAYKNDEMQARLDETAKTIGLLSQYFVDTSHEEAMAVGANRSFRKIKNAADMERPERESAQQRGKRYRISRLFFDSLFVAISLLIAVYSGLSQLYFGQAFGTWHDYMKIFLWGFGVQTTLTAVVAGLNLLWNSRASLRLSESKR